ncbi:hypothetical protein HYS48_05010 [Candidatus Woesearchaeota archaeon]|nr:hypothetical protein [Candidatus Woesearchaeota archaeon]
MAKMGNVCGSHASCMGCGWIWIVVGALFLIRDLGYWTFFNIDPLTAIIVLLGLHMLCGYKSCAK